MGLPFTTSVSWCASCPGSALGKKNRLDAPILPMSSTPSIPNRSAITSTAGSSIAILSDSGSTIRYRGANAVWLCEV